jgi:topoisomerase-4 subunit A
VNFILKHLNEFLLKKRIYKQIEQCKTGEAVFNAVRDGFEPYKDLIPKNITDEDIQKLLEIRIRRHLTF